MSKRCYFLARKRPLPTLRARFMPKVPFLLLGLPLLALCAGCASLKSQSEFLTQQLRNLQPQPEVAPVRNEWHADQFSGSPSVVVDLSEQEAYFFKGKQLAGISEISTGRG